jgi:hypothetical protein
VVCGVLAEFLEIAFEMMSWDQELLKAKKSLHRMVKPQLLMAKTLITIS